MRLRSWGKKGVNESLIQNAKIVHLEAFQFEGGTKAALDEVIALAKKHDTLISLDLNDQYLIERNHQLFQTIVKNDVDILFVNETESRAYTGTDDHKVAGCSISYRGEYRGGKDR